MTGEPLRDHAVALVDPDPGADAGREPDADPVPDPGGSGPGSSELLIDTMPVAMFVIDRVGTIAMVNQRLVEMVGIPRAGFVGRSALDFIDEHDLDFVLSLLAAGPEHAGDVMGPSRVRYVDASGERLVTQFWANETPAGFGVDGYIVTLTPESVHDVLATATAEVRADATVERALAAVATAGRAAPLNGIGSLLVVEPTGPSDGDRFRLVGSWPLSPELINAYGTPWRRCLVQGVGQDLAESGGADIDARTGAEMAMAGLPVAWVRPVFSSDGDVIAVYIVWRRTRQLVSANQEVHLGEAVRHAHVALDQARHRRERELAGQRDALTGVGNRASLNDRIALDQTHPDVLFIDLDHFRSINDTFGHGVGDEVIAQVGRRITEAVRRGDDVYRMGGDEFVVVCAPGRDRDGRLGDLHALAARVVERISGPFDCREHRVRIRASVGTAAGEDPAGAPRALRDTIIAADRARFVAKERGRGCVHHAR